MHENTQDALSTSDVQKTATIIVYCMARSGGMGTPWVTQGRGRRHESEVKQSVEEPLLKLIEGLEQALGVACWESMN